MEEVIVNQTGGISHITQDYLIVEGDKTYAGRHLLLDLYGCFELDSVVKMEQTLRDAVLAANATLLHIHIHHFGQNFGVSGVAVLAESHITVHTWPERNYAAFDIFMCGQAQPEKALEVIKLAYPSKRLDCYVSRRGENIA